MAKKKQPDGKTRETLYDKKNQSSSLSTFTKVTMIISVILIALVAVLWIFQSTQTHKQEAEAQAARGKSTLVVYFSCTGTTKVCAEKIAKTRDADVFRILPAKAYTEKDLNWKDDGSRSTLEMKDPSSRPAIRNKVENMDQYDVIFLGYPIWWNEAPRIIDTFLESYDFSGKTIIPFCTSGSSEIGPSVESLKTLAPKATWQSGYRFADRASQAEVNEWLKTVKL